MRVSTENGSRSESPRPPGGRFGDALRRAEGQGAARTRDARDAARRLLDGSRSRPGMEEPGSPISSPSPPPGERAGRGGFDEATSTPELSAVARAVPAAIAAGGLKDGAPLTLSFGRSLDVELRSGPGGIELVLAPDARLARAAEAELPRVVAALRVQGVRVARAEVRPRSGGRSR